MLYDNGTVLVTQYRFVVGSETFAVSNITSTKYVMEEHPPGKRPLNFPIATLWIAGISLVILFLLVNGNSDFTVVKVIGLFLLTLAIGLLIAAFIGSIQADSLPSWVRQVEDRLNPIPVMPPATHTILVVSSAMEKVALSSNDEEYILDVLDALDQALVLKG